MEITEMRYFLAVSKHENVHRASEEIGISPGSLSKAVQKLENELGVRLFRREGRNIRLTDQGHYLKKKASEILALENSIRLEVLGAKSTFQAKIGGSSILLSQFGAQLATDLRRNYPQGVVEFEGQTEPTLFRRVLDGEIHLGITTFEVPKTFISKTIATVSFQTFHSPRHPLHERLKKEKSIPIKEVLMHPFVTPKHQILGKISSGDSTDGWRDDRFPRKIGFISPHLETMKALVQRGAALAYLPSYLSNEADLIPLPIADCHFQCTQKVKIFTRDRKEHGWLQPFFTPPR